MMADVKRFMFLLIDTVGLLVDRTRVVAGFNHTPTYQARGRGVRQWRLSCIQQECSIGDLTLSCTQTFRHSSSAARWLTGPCTSWLTWPLWRLTSLSEMSQIIAGRFLGGVTFMFVNSIIIKLSWIVLPFQNADKDCLLMYDTLAQEKDQGRHTNVLKTYDAAPKNQFIFSKHLLWEHSRKGPSFLWDQSQLRLTYS